MNFARAILCKKGGRAGGDVTVLGEFRSLRWCESYVHPWQSCGFLWTELYFVIFSQQNTVMGLVVRGKLEKQPEGQQRWCDCGSEWAALIVFNLSAVCDICTCLYFQGWSRDAVRIRITSACRQKVAFTKGEMFWQRSWHWKGIFLHAWSWWDRKATWVKGGDAAPGVEIELFPAYCCCWRWSTCCPHWELPSRSPQQSVHNFPSWMEASRTLGLRTQSHRDKARRSCHQLMYQGCVHVGGPSVPLWAPEERCGHTEQFSSHTGWLENRKQAGSFTTLTLAGCLGLRKLNNPQSKWTNINLCLWCWWGSGKRKSPASWMMEAPTGPQALGSSGVRQWEWNENY